MIMVVIFGMVFMNNRRRIQMGIDRKEIVEFEVKCKKLMLLKEHKMITEEEYHKMKKKLIEEMQI